MIEENNTKKSDNVLNTLSPNEDEEKKIIMEKLRKLNPNAPQGSVPVEKNEHKKTTRKEASPEQAPETSPPQKTTHSVGTLSKTKDKILAAISKESAVKTVKIEKDSLPVVKENIVEKEKPKQKVNPIMGAKTTILKPLRTYKDDIIEAVRRKKASLVTIVAAEQRERAKKAPLAPELPSHETARKFIVIIISVALIAAGASSVVFFYFLNTQNTTPKELGISALVFSESEKEFEIIDLVGDDLIKSLYTEKENTSISLNTIQHLYITKETLLGKHLLDTKDFFEELQMQIPKPLLRSFESKFMLGIHAFDGNQPFFILKTKSFDNTFAGMLNWEETMSSDLTPLFGPFINKSLIALEEGRAIPTIGTAVFTDTIIKSRDARVLLNAQGKIALLYSFIDKETVILTTNEHTFNEIVTRLSSTRTLR